MQQGTHRRRYTHCATIILLVSDPQWLHLRTIVHLTSTAQPHTWAWHTHHIWHNFPQDDPYQLKKHRSCYGVRSSLRTSHPTKKSKRNLCSWKYFLRKCTPKHPSQKGPLQQRAHVRSSLYSVPLYEIISKWKPFMLSGKTNKCQQSWPWWVSQHIEVCHYRSWKQGVDIHLSSSTA